MFYGGSNKSFFLKNVLLTCHHIYKRLFLILINSLHSHSSNVGLFWLK
jgi:hypothetical protein